MERTGGRADTVGKKRRGPWGAGWPVRVALALSIAANLALAVKFVIFDPNQVLRPECFDTFDGVVSLEGRTTADFRRSMLHGWGMFNWRVDLGGTVYVSRWDLWRHQDLLWNWTWRYAEAVYREKTGKVVDPKISTSGCEFIRPRVLEKSGKSK